MTEVPEAWVEKAAEEVFLDERNASMSGMPWPEWDELSDDARLPYMVLGRASIAAVLPHVREQMAAERDALAATVAKVQEYIVQVNAMDPEAYKTGQDHLSPAFREVNFKDAFMDLAKIVNGIEAAVAPPDPATQEASNE